MKIAILETNYKTVRDVIEDVAINSCDDTRLYGQGVKMARIKRPYHVFADDFPVQPGDTLTAEDKEHCQRMNYRRTQTEEEMADRLAKLEKLLED